MPQSEVVPQAKRILGNIQVLLTAGLFAGEISSELTEARAFVAKMIADIPEEPKKDAPANEPNQETAG